MKADFDTVIYVVIIIALLVISALGSRRKKRLQQMQAPSSPELDQDLYEPVDEETGSSAFPDSEPAGSQWSSFGPERPAGVSAPQASMDPLQRLEQFLGGATPGYRSMEGETLELIVDEEEEILEEIQKEREVTRPEVPIEKVENEPIQITTMEPESAEEWFKGARDIRRAIIYSEILKRKFE